MCLIVLKDGRQDAVGILLYVRCDPFTDALVQAAQLTQVFGAALGCGAVAMGGSIN